MLVGGVCGYGAFGEDGGGRGDGLCGLGGSGREWEDEGFCGDSWSGFLDGVGEGLGMGALW